MSNAVISDWPSGSANTGWPQEPSAMLMPGRVQGWPAGTQRAANAAQRLLSQAVAWWDVEQYRDGDRFLRNLGTAGELLDLRLGSSIAPNSNDPLYRAPEDRGYVYLSGVAGNFLSVPDENALDITGDIDIRCRVALDNWSSVAPVTTLVSKRNATTNQRGYAFLFTSGTLVLRLSGDGTTETDATSSANVAAANGDLLDVRATWRASDGRVQFFTSTDGGANWTQLGSDRTTAIASIYANTAVLEIGASSAGIAFAAAGKFYRAQVLSGINGTTVLDVDCDAITTGSATSFTAVSNQTVTINRSTAGRKSVAVPSRSKGGKPVMLLGADDYLEVQDNWQHGLLGFDQGQSLTVLAAYRRWATGTVNVLGKDVGAANSFYVNSSSSPNVTFGITTGAAAPINAFADTSLGSVAVTGGVRDTARRIFAAIARGAPNTSPTADTTGSLANTSPMRVGRVGNSGYADMEFYGAVIFRRALSPAEIKTISDYMTARIA